MVRCSAVTKIYLPVRGTWRNSYYSLCFIPSLCTTSDFISIERNRQHANVPDLVPDVTILWYNKVRASWLRLLWEDSQNDSKTLPVCHVILLLSLSQRTKSINASLCRCHQFFSKNYPICFGKPQHRVPIVQFGMVIWKMMGSVVFQN